MKRTIYVSIGLVLTLVLATMAGCSTAEEKELDYPFEVQYMLGEGHRIGFSGDAAGHTPGESSEFVISLINTGTKVWNDRYFIQLVDEISVVETLHEAQITVGPADSEVFPVKINFPADLEKKAYGLAIFIPNRMAAVTNIYVGSTYHSIPATTTWAEPEVP